MGWLQRGRAHASAEISHNVIKCSKVLPCFNGAALTRARRYPQVRSPPPPPGCFNGAALTRARRYALCRGNVVFNVAASTGPRSRERGDQSARSATRRARDGFNGAALTRARRFSSGHVHATSVFLLQRGRAHASAEMTDSRCLECLSEKLQRGRAHASAEMQRSPRNLPSRGYASTGPRSRERGDSLDRTVQAAVPLRFNGAALTRARRSLSNNPINR